MEMDSATVNSSWAKISSGYPNVISGYLNVSSVWPTNGQFVIISGSLQFVNIEEMVKRVHFSKTPPHCPYMGIHNYTSVLRAWSERNRASFQTAAWVFERGLPPLIVQPRTVEPQYSTITMLTPYATTPSTRSSHSCPPATHMSLPSHATATPLNLSRLSDWSGPFYYVQITVSDWMSDLRPATRRAVRHSVIVRKRHRSLQDRSARNDDDCRTRSVIGGVGPGRLPTR